VVSSNYEEPAVAANHITTLALGINLSETLWVACPGLAYLLLQREI
jgi:hypothetical protein